MFYGAIAETSAIVRVTDMDDTIFGIILRYIYNDELPVFDCVTAFSALYAAKKYGIPLLKAACEKYLKTHTTTKDCLAGLAQAKAYDEQELVDFFLHKIDSCAASVLYSAEFAEISIDILKEIFSRDTLRRLDRELFDHYIELLTVLDLGGQWAYECVVQHFISYVDITRYHKVDELVNLWFPRWAKERCAQRKIIYSGKNCRTVLKDVMFLSRFPLLDDKYLAEGAKNGFLTAKGISQLFHLSTKLPAKFITRKRTTPST